MALGIEKSWRKDLLRLSVMTLITVVVWIGVVTYKALTKGQIQPDLQKAILPLTPTLDLDTMDQIKQKQSTPPIDWSSVSLPKEASGSSQHESQ